MGIYIPNMEMPKDGTYSIVYIYSDGHISMPCWGKGMQIVSGITAVQLPEGHGRLIDGDAVTQEAYRRLLECQKYGNEFEKPYEVIRAIETAKTIVPAEGGNADGNGS